MTEGLTQIESDRVIDSQTDNDRGIHCLSDRGINCQTESDRVIDSDRQ